MTPGPMLGRPRTVSLRRWPGINPRSKFYVDAAGVAQVVWLSADIQAFRADMIRPDLTRDFSALHVINQVVATAVGFDPNHDHALHVHGRR